MNENNTKKALVVDDEIPICKICERVLSKEGFQVDIVHNGKTAREAILKNTYDLLLVDIMLPEESGMDLFIWMKQEYPHVIENIIFMTGGILGSDTMNFLQGSKKPYLLKPFRPAELADIVRETFTGE